MRNVKSVNSCELPVKGGDHRSMAHYEPLKIITRELSAIDGRRGHSKHEFPKMSLGVRNLARSAKYHRPAAMPNIDVDKLHEGPWCFHIVSRYCR